MTAYTVTRVSPIVDGRATFEVAWSGEKVSLVVEGLDGDPALPIQRFTGLGLPLNAIPALIEAVNRERPRGGVAGRPMEQRGPALGPGKTLRRSVEASDGEDAVAAVRNGLTRVRRS
jgi:hypothetical protein